MKVSAQEQELHTKMSSEIAATAKFLGRYKTARQLPDTGPVSAFDSAIHSSGQVDLNAYPESLRAIFDSVFCKSPDAKEVILSGIESGIKAYGRFNGGDLPSAELVAAGLSAGSAMLASGSTEGKAFFDSISRNTGISSAQFDSMTYGGHESLSVVPALVMVTIASRIASGIPTIAYLPNPAGTNELPLLYGRPTASKDWGAFSQGDFLDGDKAGSHYFCNHWQFAMTPGTGPTALVYTVTPTVKYTDATALTPDGASDDAPFLGGRVRILVNGIEVAHDRYKGHAVKSGASTLVAVEGVTIGATAVLVASGNANLTTHLITATFDAALPVGAVVTAEVIFDFERKGSDGKALLTPPGIDIALEGESLFATPMRALVTATIDAITQMRNELGIDPRAAAMGIVQGKFYLEETVRLLKASRQRAIASDRQFGFDGSRGVSGDMAAAFNTTGELMAEVRKSLGQAKQSISMASNASPAGFDVFVGNNGALLFGQLSELNGYTAVPGMVYSTDTISRIGQFDDGTNVYHVPGNIGLLTESATAAQFLVIARQSDPAKAAIVGHVAVPPMMVEYLAEPFEQGAGVYSRVAGELNPIGRFADQSAVINAINLPTLG